MSDLKVVVFNENNERITGPVNLCLYEFDLNPIGPSCGHIKIQIQNPIDYQKLCENIFPNSTSNSKKNILEIKNSANDIIHRVENAIVTSCNLLVHEDEDEELLFEVTYQHLLYSTQEYYHQFMLEGDWTGYDEESYSDLIGTSNHDWIRFGF